MSPTFTHGARACLALCSLTGFCSTTPVLAHLPFELLSSLMSPGSGRYILGWSAKLPHASRSCWWWWQHWYCLIGCHQTGIGAHLNPPPYGWCPDLGLGEGSGVSSHIGRGAYRHVVGGGSHTTVWDGFRKLTHTHPRDLKFYEPSVGLKFVFPLCLILCSSCSNQMTLFLAEYFSLWDLECFQYSVHFFQQC